MGSGKARKVSAVFFASAVCQEEAMLLHRRLRALNLAGRDSPKAEDFEVPNGKWFSVVDPF